MSVWRIMGKMLKSRYFDVLLSSIIVLAIIAYTIFQNLAAQQAIVIYVLDNNMKAIDYPHTIFWNGNSSLSFYIGVENKRWTPIDAYLMVKLASNKSWNRGVEPCPARSLLKIPISLNNGESRIIPLKIDILEVIAKNKELIVTKVNVNGNEALVYLPVGEDDYLSIIVELWSNNEFTGQWVELKLRLKQVKP